MNVWTVQFEEHWSYDKKGEYQQNGMTFIVTAKNSDDAIAKAKKLAGIGKVYEDDEGDEYSLESIRLIGLDRGITLDG